MSTDLFADIFGAPDRDRCVGAAPVISYRNDDEPAFLRAIDARAVERVRLARRGVDHGAWAVLAPHDERGDSFAARWAAARPIVRPGIVRPRIVRPGALRAHGALEQRARRCDARLALYERLRRPGGLRAWLAELELPAGLRVAPREASLADPERDVERVLVDDGPHAASLWLKSARLSTFPADASLRVRVAFGREIDDDASTDERSHARVAALARAVLPGADEVVPAAPIGAFAARLAGRPLLFTQHIAYWNAPQGGALFHHDAFDQPHERRQLGVLYVQLAGRTAWLALSSADLAARVRELEGEGSDWTDEELGDELAAPGCGRLAGVVNDPEMTGLLADAGHAWVLGAGDAILLPNHGHRRTAMHSVFCADERPTYGLSMALRGA